MSLEDYDYSIITKNTKCNNCNKQKLCHQCNECFVFTCDNCILGTVKKPRFPQCNNCNNIFVELSISNPNYARIINNIRQRIQVNYKPKSYHNINIKEIDELVKDINKKLWTLSRIVIRDIKNGVKKIHKLLKDIIYIIKFIKCIKRNDNIYYHYYCHYIKININYPIIVEINNLLFEIFIYIIYKKICDNSIYYEPNFDKLKDDMSDFVNDGKFDYLKSEHIIRINKNHIIYKLIYNCVNAKNICISGKRHKECVSDICIFEYKYYKNNIDYSQCPKCKRYNRKFENYTQVCCSRCMLLYNFITKQIETHIINPSIYWYIDECKYSHVGIGLHNTTLSIQLDKYIDKLISKSENKSHTDIIHKIKSLPQHTNFYMIFKHILSMLKE